MAHARVTRQAGDRADGPLRDETGHDRTGGTIRALVREPGRISPALYRRFWRRAQIEAMIPDLMVRGEPYLALNALVLTEADHRCLDRLTTVFSRVFQAAGQRVASDVATTIGLGFPWAAAELLARERCRLPLIGRFDFVQDEAGCWKLLELNADTPSGVREGIVCDRLVAELLPEATGLERPSRDLGARLTDAILGALAEVQHRGGPQGIERRAPRRMRGDPLDAKRDVPPRVLGIVTTASELEDLSQMAFTADLLRPALAAHGWQVVLGDAANLRLTGKGLTLVGQPVDALYRYLPFEAIFGTPTFLAMEDAAAAGRVEILNGLYGLLLQNKGLIAWIWDHRDDADLFDEEARAAIVAHLPPTWPIGEVPAGTERDGLVAKQVFGREGQEVFFGEDCRAELWETLTRRQTYVAQARVWVAPVQAVVQTSLGPVVREGYPTVGCFAVDGQFVGLYTRFGEKITTARAKWLATFSEPGDRDG